MVLLLVVLLSLINCVVIVVALCCYGVIDALFAGLLCLFDLAIGVVIVADVLLVVMLLLCCGLALLLSFLWLQLLCCY